MARAYRGRVVPCGLRLPELALRLAEHAGEVARAPRPAVLAPGVENIEVYAAALIDAEPRKRARAQ